MKVEEANKIVEAQLEKLAEALAAGKSDTLRNYLSTMSKMYKYSFRNLLLIQSQKPDASYVAGFQSWRKLGRWVKKGEKAITIITPINFKRESANADKVEEQFTMFRAGHVFDFSQTEGEPLANLATVGGDPGDQLESLKSLVKDHQISLEYQADLNGADGLSKGGIIVIKEGLSPAVEFSVLVHELAHELLHKGTVVESKTVRETEAEAVAFVVSEAIGLTTTDASSDYIQLYSGDSETLKSSLERIQKTSTTILSGLNSPK